MRTRLTAAVAAIIVAGLSGAAYAVPPCNQFCESVCLFSPPTYCALLEPCKMKYSCDGFNYYVAPCACSGGCFVAGTKITMADGTEKPIEAIRVGDMILAYDEKTGELKPDRVSVVHDPVEADGYLVVNGKLLLTKLHPVLTPSGFKEIGTLAVGDKLIGADKKEIAIASIRAVPDHVTVYNFATNPYGTYIANGVIVHNKPPKPIEEPPPQP